MDTIKDAMLATSIPAALFAVPIINFCIRYFIEKKMPRFHQWMKRTIGIQSPLNVKREGIDFNYERK
ncbi:hypothetical protein [Oceanobacillus sojae]|uniref:Uncharacterized protein n=1 Tax=Oceanobacillus sojae TaxID=582851 RepID=A0A511ZIG9_9BACI|nr:hypothetical protein [Oceanobacillus sojae]GEN87243.1 hypothetical protein OSO01_19820 [Oceanobacillus sojae]